MVKALFLTSVALVGLAFLAFFVVPILYSSHPELFGSHPAFYRRCKSLEPGMTLAEARVAMSDYLEIGRTWQPPPSMPGGLFDAQVVTVHESGDEHRTRLIFIPDEDSYADWCILYPSGQTLQRVEISPD